MAPKNTWPAWPSCLRNPPCPTQIHGDFSDFTEYCGLENNKPDGLGLGGQKGQNPLEPIHAHP